MQILTWISAIKAPRTPSERKCPSRTLPSPPLLCQVLGTPLMTPCLESDSCTSENGPLFFITALQPRQTGLSNTSFIVITSRCIVLCFFINYSEAGHHQQDLFRGLLRAGEIRPVLAEQRNTGAQWGRVQRYLRHQRWRVATSADMWQPFD